MTTLGDNPDRIATEAGFAALCGCRPETRLQRHNPPHRLSRGGDRQTNQALYLIAGSRLATDPATRAYRDRRLSDPDPHATTTSKDVRRGPLRQPR